MTWLDWLFAPLRCLTRAVGVTPGTTFGEFVAAYLVTSILVAIALFVALAVVYFGLRWFDLAFERLMRWSARGADLVTHRTMARRYLAVADALSWMRLRTGIRVGSSEARDRGRVVWRRETAGRRFVRTVLGIPGIAISFVRTVWVWAGSVAGLYVLIGLLWLRDRSTDILSEAVTAVFAALANPAIAAVVAVVVAILAILLDHGLTPRLRARNGHQRDRAVEAEQTLEALETDAVDLVRDLDNGTDEYVRLMDAGARSAVDFVSDGACRIVDGKVEARPADTIPPVRGAMGSEPDWRADDPWVTFDVPTAGRWDPAGEVRRDVEKMRSLLTDDPHFWRVWRQAPRRARSLLLDLRPLSARPGASGTLPTSMQALERSHLRRTLTPILGVTTDSDTPDVRAERLQRAWAGVCADVDDALWEFSVSRERAAFFVNAVDSWQRPRGRLRRLLSRVV